MDFTYEVESFVVCPGGAKIIVPKSPNPDHISFKRYKEMIQEEQWPRNQKQSVSFKSSRNDSKSPAMLPTPPLSPSGPKKPRFSSASSPEQKRRFNSLFKVNPATARATQGKLKESVKSALSSRQLQQANLKYLAQTRPCPQSNHYSHFKTQATIHSANEKRVPNSIKVYSHKLPPKSTLPSIALLAPPKKGTCAIKNLPKTQIVNPCNSSSHISRIPKLSLPTSSQYSNRICFPNPFSSIPIHKSRIAFNKNLPAAHYEGKGYKKLESKFDSALVFFVALLLLYFLSVVNQIIV